MHPSLRFRVWILQQSAFRLLYNFGHFGKLNEVIDTVALVLQMEARVLEGVRLVYDGLPDVLDLLLAGDHYLVLARLMGQLDGELEDVLRRLSRLLLLLAILLHFVGLRSAVEVAIGFGGCRVLF